MDRSQWRVLTKQGPLEEEMINLSSILAESPVNSMKRQKYMTLAVEPSGLEGIQYATGEEWRAIANSSRKNEATGLKWK